MKKSHKAQEISYEKPAQTPWLTKDDVAKQLCLVHRSFEIADNQSSSWTVDEATGAVPELPNWQVLLHSELYGPIEDLSDAVKRKYFGFFPREA